MLRLALLRHRPAARARFDVFAAAKGVTTDTAGTAAIGILPEARAAKCLRRVPV